MRETFGLGRIAGIRVGINASVLVIVLVIAVGLALGRFPLVLPGRGTVAYVVAGLVAAVAFLASLLAHEMAHALVARRNGVEVEGITLWLLGGVARLRGGAASPGAEFRIAGVGPLTSLLLGVLLGAAGLLARAAGVGGLPVAVLDYLAGINVVLAVFNLVPAAPLDGGRLLRAFLWRLRGDAWSSAVMAARAGRLFGFALIALGILQVVTGRGFGGLWLALVGLFVINAARLHGQGGVRRVDRPDAVQPRRGQDDLPSRAVGDRPPAQAGVAALRHQRPPGRSAEQDDPRDLLGAARTDDQGGAAGVGAAPVGLVPGGVRRLRQTAVLPTTSRSRATRRPPPWRPRVRRCGA